MSPFATQFGVLCLVLLYGVEAKANYNITDDTVFYGQSPPVYPSPNGTGIGDWADAYAKARALVSKMTLEEKVNIAISIPMGGDHVTGCEGRVEAIPRVGFPGLCLADAGHGLRNAELVSAWPIGMSVGASWNKKLALQRATGMGAEFKKKGVNVIFGPIIGPQDRIGKGGRNWEGFSSDPWQNGKLGYESVKGLQSAGVIASAAFVANEQETRRSTSTFFYEDETTTQAVSTNIDGKTMHELYVWPFVDALHAGAANIMCSYQRLNNSYSCQNSKVLNGLLKTELNFQGFVITDWGAQHAGVATAMAGMDSAALPEGGDFETMLWGLNLTLAVRNGSVPETRLDDMVTRTLAAWYKLGQDQDFPEPGIGFQADTTLPHKSIDARDPAYDDVLLQGATEGHVLVKNVNNALPLKKPKMLGIYGYSARNRDSYEPNNVLGPLQIDDHTLDHVIIDRNGTIYSGGGSGTKITSLATGRAAAGHLHLSAL
ncbi:glycoside hydrolase superfamily [Xylaria digitata]|nr:glycoside hydrolase superfamily [Xylaria digitata]